MLYIANESLDPHYNLAFEEYVLKELDPEESYVLLWQNAPSVIIGRFQNTLEEINVDYIRKNNIYVVRRNTGGGAVYHDLGNLNFSFIEKNDENEIDFSRFTERIAKVLAQMGVTVEFSGRNDITIDGKKFSGNAQYQYRGKTLHHGTILYNSNLEHVQAALKVKTEKIESKGVKSVRSRVTNIIDYLPTKPPLKAFQNMLLEYLFQPEPVSEYVLSEVDQARIKELMAEKYLTWEWNHGSAPAFNIIKSGRFLCGGIEVYLSVEKGRIKSCKIYGDFFSNLDINILEQKLQGLRYEKKDLEDHLDAEEIRLHFGTLKKEEFIRCLVG